MTSDAATATQRPGAALACVQGAKRGLIAATVVLLPCCSASLRLADAPSVPFTMLATLALRRKASAEAEAATAADNSSKQQVQWLRMSSTPLGTTANAIPVVQQRRCKYY